MTASEPLSPPSIGQRVLKLRRGQGLTLEQLATRAGISKSMLSQIERDRTNPTLATVWRLTHALGIGLEQVLRSDDAPQAVELVRSHATPTINSADGGCTARILGPLEMAGTVEWYEVAAEPGAALVSEAHEPDTVEHLTVLEGEFAVESAGEIVRAATGETVRYRADCPHSVRNTGDGPARALMVVVLGGPRTPPVGRGR